MFEMETNSTLRIELTMRYTAEWDNDISLNGTLVQCYEHCTRANPPLINAVGAGMDFTMPSHPFIALVGFIRAFRVAEPDSKTVRPHLGGHMISHPTISTRTQIIGAISKLREEWQEIADGASLVELKGSVGLLLADLALALGLSPDEQVQVLGEKLANELQEVLLTLPGSNGNH
jgi:hypothetical protein